MSLILTKQWRGLDKVDLNTFLEFNHNILFPLRVRNQNNKKKLFISSYQSFCPLPSQINRRYHNLLHFSLSYCLSEYTMSSWDPHCNAQEAKLCHISKQRLYQQRLTQAKLTTPLEKKSIWLDWTCSLLTFCLSQTWCRYARPPTMTIWAFRGLLRYAASCLCLERYQQM